MYFSKLPAPGMRIFICYAYRLEPKFGLEPRFEDLPKTGKSPNTPGGVRAKALTPHPQRVNILIPSAYFYTLDNNKPNSNFSCLNLSPTRNAQYHVKL